MYSDRPFFHEYSMDKAQNLGVNSNIFFAATVLVTSDSDISTEIINIGFRKKENNLKIVAL